MSTTASWSTTHHQVVGKCNGSGTPEFTGENILGRSPTEGLRGFGARSGESRQQKAHRTVARFRFALHVFKLACLEHFWKMKLAKCAPDCSESSVSHKNRLKLHVRSSPGFVWTSRHYVSAEPTLSDSVPRSCFRGLATGCDKTRWHDCA